MAHKSLYRVWRPERFSDVAGQDHIVKVLTGEIESGRVSHAYLFAGPRGTGKTSMAKIFAKAVNCANRQGAEPCGACAVCSEASSGNSTDILEIDAASNNGVDSVRDLRDRVALLPAACKYKVYIIDEVHMLSAGAFNALLKTLEEPPGHVIFILATTEPHKLPATIRSRCQRFDFARIGAATIAQRLRKVVDVEGFKASDEALRMIARAADGAMRDALSMLDQCCAYDDITADIVSRLLGGGNGQALSSLVERIVSYDEKGALETLRGLIDAGADTRTLIKDIADIFRRIMWISAGAGAEEQDAYLKPLAQSFGKAACLRALDILLRKEYDMRLNLRADIVLETAVLGIMCPDDEKGAPDQLRLDKLEARLRALEAGGIKTVAAEAAPKIDPKAKKAPEAKKPQVEKANPAQPGDKIWEAVLDTLKKEAYFIYTYARKAKGASRSDGRLEITFGAEDSVAAEYMKQPSAQSAMLKKLESDGIASVSVSIENKAGNTGDKNIHEMFEEIEEVQEV